MLEFQLLDLLALGGDQSMRLGVVTLISPSFTCVVAGLEGNGRLFDILPKALIVLVVLTWVLVLLLRESLVDLIVSPLCKIDNTLPPDIWEMGWNGKLALMRLLASRMRLT